MQKSRSGSGLNKYRTVQLPLLLFFLKIIPFSIKNNGITDILISVCLNSLFHCAFQTSLLASALILLYWQESKESHPSSQQLKKVYRYQIYCYREYNFHTLVFSEVVFKDTVLPFNFTFWDKEHYEVTMSGALMANYYISWRLENNVMSSKYLVMHALHDHWILNVTVLWWRHNILESPRYIVKIH